MCDENNEENRRREDQMSDGKYSDSEASLHVQFTIGLITGEFCVTLKWSCVTLNWGSTW